MKAISSGTFECHNRGLKGVTLCSGFAFDVGVYSYGYALAPFFNIVDYSAIALRLNEDLHLENGRVCSVMVEVFFCVKKIACCDRSVCIKLVCWFF